MITISRKTTSININGRETVIDIDCSEMVEWFNDIGLTTKYSCSGHGEEPFSIHFDPDITDEQMLEFIESYQDPDFGHTPFPGYFVKWYRVRSGELIGTWKFLSPHIYTAKRSFKIMKKYYNKD